MRMRTRMEEDLLARKRILTRSTLDHDHEYVSYRPTKVVCVYEAESTSIERIVSFEYCIDSNDSVFGVYQSSLGRDTMLTQVCN